jgi:tetratricopeptide (TPR) repeat protein
MTTVRYLAIGLYLLLASLAFPQAQQSDLATSADMAYQKKDWTTAEKLYSQLSQASGNVPRYWYRLGVSAQGQGEHQTALNAFEKAKSKGSPAFLTDYSIACVYASMGETDKAFTSLSAAVKGGFARPEQMSSDADLQSLRLDPRFNALVEQAKHNQTPCDYITENRQFDFWVGEWEVVPTAGGLPQGSSHIEKELGDCVIWENWKSLGNGYAGKSYNIYNTSLKRWEQFWVDNIGGMIHFYGGLKDGVMDYWTDDMPQPDGTKLRRHLQFFNQGPNKVRQFSQGSKDGGKTWNVEYDLTYVRKDSGSAKGK